MGKKLFVGSLSYNTNEEGLRSFFEQAGQVESVAIITDKLSGRSKGFGFVEMGSDEEARKAVEMCNGKELDGRTIVVDEARPMQPRAPRSFDRGDRGNRKGNRFRNQF